MPSSPKTPYNSALSARSLRYLHEIEVHGGVRAAADALSINGSVISRQVANLERVYGVALLERRGRRVALTEIGMSLVEHFRDSSRRDEEMLEQLEDYRGLRRGRLEIGIGEGFVENLLATVLEQFSLQFPDIVVELRSGATAEIIVMVRNDEVDMGLCAGGSSDPAIRARAFRAAPLCALVSPQHALASERRIRVEQLAAHRLIFMPARFGVQNYLDSLSRAERLNLTPTYRCDLFSAAQAIAAAGLGVAFMSTDAARQYLDAGKLVALEIDHPIAREFGSQVIRRVGRRLSPAAEFLWTRLIKVMQQR
ncbi:LysR family transcriptional regulator [Paraburkholderia ginsengisoli]|uniref:LysR family transcriptional regulator n=1 Tax=Paraburkholderia ginsengisoli TaxID=311231 RepID=A0A7T4TC77_9BURK|nr:LysR substrate-binding domain-containing protein [Paraburkholderia ginsengisoli]QQC67952.1 LysR family transcriptional regulator [Paraburkholderia ginsengisoli]